MAAEAIHLTALSDAREDPALPADLRAFLRAPEAWQAARLGALIVDFPYFERFPLKALRFGLGLPQPRSHWGDLFHQRCPVAVGRALLDAARGLDERRRRRIVALALGYFSHLAVDTATHPLVNRIARARRARDGGDELSHHQDVEKYQSVLFHQERHGYDFLGTPAVVRYVSVGTSWLRGDAACFQAWQGALRTALGEAPRRATLNGWARGYRQYGWLLGSPIGGRLVDDAGKARETPLVYRGPRLSYPRLYRAALRRVVRYLTAAWRTAQGEPFDEQAVPEGSIDDPQRACPATWSA